MTYNFIYSVPYTNHVYGLPNLQFEIEATLSELGYVTFKRPVSEFVRNHQEMYKHIQSLAWMEFEIRIVEQEMMILERENRIKDGENILADLFDTDNNITGRIISILFLIAAILVTVR